jgi:hypothetical protein
MLYSSMPEFENKRHWTKNKKAGLFPVRLLCLIPEDRNETD